MILTTIIGYLEDHLDVPVCLEAPKDATNYVLLDFTGASKTDHIKTSTIAVQSYGPTLYAAALLNEQVLAVMDTLPELPEIVSSRLETHYNFTNTATKQHRWQAVYHITHY